MCYETFVPKNKLISLYQIPNNVCQNIKMNATLRLFCTPLLYQKGTSGLINFLFDQIHLMHCIYWAYV